MNLSGYDDYSKVVKYNETNGEEFSTLASDRSYMVNTLGMTREDHYTKLITDLINT